MPRLYVLASPPEAAPCRLCPALAGCCRARGRQGQPVGREEQGPRYAPASCFAPPVSSVAPVGGSRVCDAGGRDVGGVAEASGGDVVRAPKPADRAAEGGGHGGRPRLHATENSTPPWKPRAGGERVGEARDGEMGGASAGGMGGARIRRRRRVDL
jgi:hypothetical protein